MKIKIKLFCLLLFLGAFFSFKLSGAESQEAAVFRGDVVSGLDKEEALEKFGYPVSATEDIWQYDNPREFFVYFPSGNIASLYLYPASCGISVGLPLEFRAFACFSDFKIKDVTAEVELLVNEPQNLILEKPGLIVPRNAGEYRITAKYKNIYSNPISLSVADKSRDKEAREEQLLSISILPYNPKVPLGLTIDFSAYGIFLNPRKNIYTVREVTNEAQWFIQQDESVIRELSGKMRFSSLGKWKVFCEYQNLESDRQEVEVKEAGSLMPPELKGLTLLPEFVITPGGNAINFLAVASYNNRSEDVTAMVSWEIKDKEILDMPRKGDFLSKSPGVTQVTAGLYNLKSPYSKVIVLEGGEPKDKAFAAPLDLQKSQAEKKEMRSYKDLTKDIKKEVEKIKKSSIAEEKRIVSIKITPEHLRISLGEKKRLSAWAVYNDGSEADLTLLGDWVSSDKRIAVVSQGEVSAFSPGEIKTHLEFKGISSMAVPVTVEKAKLISVVVSPPKTRLSIEDKLSLSAEGRFSDSSVKDITSLVQWRVAVPGIIKVEKGLVYPVGFGLTRVYAEYSDKESLPVEIRVVFSIMWLLKIGGGIFLFLIFNIFLVLLIFYFITKSEEKRLLSRYDRPAEFIACLYGNVRKILNIFGVQFQESGSLLAYAELIETQYSLKNSIFSKFTAKFEEAKYSKHVLQEKDADAALSDYNQLLKEILASYAGFSLIIRYCLILLSRRPLLLMKA